MPLAAVPFLLLPYDSLTHMLGLDPAATSQSLPAAAVFSLVYILLREGQLRFSPVSLQVFRLLAAAGIVIATATLCNILVESSGLVNADVDIRLATAIRQGVSFALGLTSFLMFQDAMVRIGLQSACRWIVVGAVPSLILCAIQIQQGFFRIQGFSSEPSLLGDMLVFAFLPACFYANLGARRRFVTVMSGLFALLTSFSGTAIMKGVFALFTFSAVKGQFFRGLIVTVIVASITYGALLLYPDNYIFHLFGLLSVFLDSGMLVGGSFIDRFFGLVGPLNMLATPHGWLGLGLGGDTVYFDRMFDADTAEVIRSQKHSVASISSLQGKVLLYGGIFGTAFYLAAWWLSWRAAPTRHPARFILPTLFAASLFSLGPFFLPYVWLWLAFGATANRRQPALRHETAGPSPGNGAFRTYAG